MATLGITVKSDFDQASKDLKDFKATSESTEKSIKKFQDSFKSEQIDKFLDKQRLSSVALKTTRGQAEANKIEYNNLRREIERLIKRGIDPQDKSVQKLTKRYDELEKEIEQTTQAQKKSVQESNNAIKVANLLKMAWAAVGISASAAVAAIVKNTFSVATAGDEYAKASRRIGLTAEDLQELTFAADRQGVSGEELTKGLEKLNKNVGDLRAGYGSLNTVLKATNPELLKNLTNAKNNNEAFELSVNALNRTSNELERASLAQALFGRSGLKLLTVTEAGTDGIKALREEARRYGIISNENAKRAEEFVDAQTNLNAVLTNFKNEVGVRLFPAIKGVLEITTNLFQKDRDLRQVTSDLIKANREYAKITNTLADENENLTSTEEAKLKIRKAELKLDILTNIREANKLYKEQKNIIPELTKEINNNRIRLEGAAKNAEIYQKRIEAYGDASKVSRREKQKLNQEIRNLNITIAAAQKYSTDLATAELELTKKTNDYDEAVKSLAFALKNELVSKADILGINKEFIEDALKLAETLDFESAAIKNNTEKLNENFITKQDALTALKELEGLSYKERIMALNDFNTKVINSMNLSEKVKQDLIKKANSEMSKLEKNYKDQRIKNFEEIKNIYFQIGNEIVNIIDNISKNQRASAIAQKIISIAQAVINTALGITKALSTGNVAKAVAIGILGAAQVAKISTTPIPSAQTGTNPEGLEIRQPRRTGQDQIGLRVNEGEDVTVKTRGETTDNINNTKIMIGESVLFEVIQRGIDNGNINITDDNIQVATT